ncbi:glycosyltransferase family 1 protein [Shewanella bicestrii]|uniref:glycosyltransferase family 1 protein n=1 Tax=Shewanella xiamenensis TaxID=332186 RepID=UPI000849A792|nr:glycosyltransferase family 1 protein [Shewanella xiamenensis]ODR86649.1 hypothetical protein ABT47_15705 [Shewanella xiamenensis]
MNFSNDIILTIDLIFIEAKLDNESFSYLSTLKSAYEQIDEYNKEQVIQHYLTNQPPIDNLNALHFFLFDLTKNSRFLEKIINSCPPNMSPQSFYEIYWNIGNRLFTNSTPVNTTSLRNIFKNLSNDMNNWLKLYKYKNKKNVNQVKNIVILSPQILGMRHSPTRESFNIACHLETYHNCNVTIINSNGFNYHNTLGLINPTGFNVNKDLNGTSELNINYMQFKDKKIKIISIEKQMMSSRKVLDILDTLKSLDTDAVISHGENLLVQEAIFGIYPSIFATTGGVVPFAHCDSYFVPGSLFDDNHRELASKYEHNDFMLENMLVTPEGKADIPASKEKLGLDNNSFIYLVVSTRMDREVTPEFIEICNGLIKSNENAHIIFSGTDSFSLSSNFDAELIDRKKVINIGFQDDLASVCLMADVYLNPKRIGGGTSSQTAIINGLPVVTLNYGHISNIVPEERRFSNWKEYMQYALELQNDNFLQSETNLFSSHFHTNMNSQLQIEKIYNKLCDIAIRKYS